ncbi:MAG: sulfoxide reductase heme-binding subunit YedZ [Anaerolineae bacterium]|jgi:methionine sulfoxide reductase heme-binding subunit|nr:sulfoxide reductase heme-binding subunit YedZ [Anaerolineae bacterium]MBT7070519.1 sulfoxide reductase heme-binding subunit YedZ [Anaerolineae bacterium]MBT7325749.1 sulfoxide reductase heme-binding subunit YedZ [Anaerolineae bacterium]
MKRKKWNFTPLQIAAHLGSLIPLAFILWDIATGNFGVDPIRDFTLRTGKTALVLLLLSLACTPVNTLFKFKQVLKLRRPLGLYSFFYASIHFAIFIGVDYYFDFTLIQSALLEKRYAIVGLTTGLILLALAVTSTIGWQRRLKKNWKKLHKLTYLAGILAVVHYIWLVKQGVLDPWYFAAILLLLLTLRIPAIRKAITTKRART